MKLCERELQLMCGYMVEWLEAKLEKEPSMAVRAHILGAQLAYKNVLSYFDLRKPGDEKCDQS